MSTVLEYKCPCCGAGLIFGEDTQKMKCEYCDNIFELDAVREYNDSLSQSDAQSFSWDTSQQSQSWSDTEQAHLHAFQCPSCGGEILTDETTAATFCPYCDNPTVMPGRLSGGLKPDAVIPFKLSKEAAQEAFKKLCKGKPLLPKMFTKEHRIEKLTGIYVPFWLYDCDSRITGKYKATRVHHWSDSRYNYTRTEHFLLNRDATAAFGNIPMDGSRKMNDAIMESIEPFDYSQLVDFDTAYLSGFFADKYDVEAQRGQERVQQRVGRTMDDYLQNTFIGYATVVPTSRNLRVSQSKAKYVLLPVWMLTTKYQDKTYVFAMNGQTGKMTGTFPICPKRSAAWFSGICLGAASIAALVQLFLL